MKNNLEQFVFIIFISIITFSCSNQYEKDLEIARSLNEDQLLALFNEIEFHWRRMDETPIDGLTNYSENSRIPEILPNLLSPRAVNPRKGYIILKPSLDEDIRMYFIGLTNEAWPSKYQAIELHYYNGPNSPISEVLWEQGQRPTK